MAANTGEGLLCILFTDVVGWTELGERVGDDVADPIAPRPTSPRFVPRCAITVAAR